RSLFGAANHAVERVLPLGKQNADQISAVVHRDVRFVINRGQNVVVVGLVVLALDGENRNAVVAYQAGGDIILRGERIRSAKHNVRAAITKADGQVSSFSRDV